MWETNRYNVKNSFIFCTFRGDITFGKLPPPPHVTLGHLLANPPPPMEVTSFVDGPPGSQVPGPRIRVPKIKMVKNEVVPWQETQDPISIPKVDA